MTDARTPLVSILIRSMDRPTLERALDCAAAQTWSDIEIVVAAASGGSHRALPALWKGRALRLVHGADGQPLARAEAGNVCLEAAHGEWLNFLDDDDELLPEHVAILLAAPRTRGERLVYARTRVIDDEGNLTGHCGIDSPPIEFFYENLTTTCGTLLHRSLVDDGARFDPDFTVYEDHDFFINCAGRTPMRFVDAATSVWHARAGESGSAPGQELDPHGREALTRRLRGKWNLLFDRWAREPNALAHAGQRNLKNNRLEAAVGLLDLAVELFPDDINALNLCGMAHHYSGHAARAQSLLERAVQRLPQHAGLRQNLELVRARRRAH